MDSIFGEVSCVQVFIREHLTRSNQMRVEYGENYHCPPLYECVTEKVRHTTTMCYYSSLLHTASRFFLTLSPPIPLRLYTLPYWCNQQFLILAFGRSGAQDWAPECQKLKWVRPVWSWTLRTTAIWNSGRWRGLSMTLYDIEHYLNDLTPLHAIWLKCYNLFFWNQLRRVDWSSLLANLRIRYNGL